MKYVKGIVIILISATVLVGCSQTSPNKVITPNEADQLINQWVDLWGSYDLNRLDEIFWTSEECTYLSSEKSGLIKGYDDLIPHHLGFGFIEGGKTPAKTLWLEDHNTQYLETTCVVTATWYFGDKSSPKDSVQQGPVTFVLLRDQDDLVKIGHTHFANY